MELKDYFKIQFILWPFVVTKVLFTSFLFKVHRKKERKQTARRMISFQRERDPWPCGCVWRIIYINRETDDDDIDDSFNLSEEYVIPREAVE